MNEWILKHEYERLHLFITKPTPQFFWYAIFSPPLDFQWIIFFLKKRKEMLAAGSCRSPHGRLVSFNQIHLRTPPFHCLCTERDREREMESEAAPFIGMLMAECAQVGLIIISKQALATGMPNFVFVCYSNALASFILLCLCLFLYRSHLISIAFSLSLLLLSISWHCKCLWAELQNGASPSQFLSAVLVLPARSYWVSN